jgi:hypothetical protein
MNMLGIGDFMIIDETILTFFCFWMFCNCLILEIVSFTFQFASRYLLLVLVKLLLEQSAENTPKV